MPPWKTSNKASATKKTNKGNDKSDKLADDGVESIQGRGLAKLAVGSPIDTTSMRPS